MPRPPLLGGLDAGDPGRPVALDIDEQHRVGVSDAGADEVGGLLPPPTTTGTTTTTEPTTTEPTTTKCHHEQGGGGHCDDEDLPITDP